MAAEITTIVISPEQFDRSLRNLARLCKIDLLTVLTVKKLNFQNPRWRIAANLKTVKSPYLRNPLTFFDKIWHGDGDWPPTGDRPLKFQIKKTQIAISQQGIDRFSQNLTRLCKMGLLSAHTVKKIEFPKSKMADGRHYKNC